MKSRFEKITYLKALQSGDKSIKEMIEAEKREQFFKSLSFAELHLITDHTEIFSDFAISSMQKVFEKYRSVTDEYMKYYETPVSIAVKFIVIDNEPCFRFSKSAIKYLFNHWCNHNNTGAVEDMQYYTENKEYIESRFV